MSKMVKFWAIFAAVFSAGAGECILVIYHPVLAATVLGLALAVGFSLLFSAIILDIVE